MKKIVFLLFILFVSLSSYAQTVLRENVVVVKPTYTTSSVSFIKKLSKLVRGNGYKDAADVLESYTEGGFGSGFIYTNPINRKSYVVTNRHVISQADFATIQFQYLNQDPIEYKDCAVIAVDERLDLALIELPANVEFPQGLEIDVTLLEEGITVYSVGFPALGNKPSWQLGQGIISNSSVFDINLSGTNTAGAIQHTAQVDAGSSGGPLLIKNDAGTYKIIGVNTWKIANRESANFAISSRTLIKFLNENADDAKRNTVQDLERRAKDFTEAIKGAYMDVLPFISNEYMSNVSADHFHEIVNAVPDSIRTKINASFNNGRPIDGVRIGLAYFILEKIAKDNLKYSSLRDITAENHKDVIFTSDKKDFNTTWIFEQGEWKLQKLPTLKLTDLETRGVSKRFGYSNSFKIGMELPLSETNTWGTQYYASYEYTYITFITGAFTVGSGKITYNPDDKGEYETKSFITGNIALGCQVPIKLSSLYFIPNLKGFIEINTKDVAGALGYIGGLEVAYKLNRKTYLLGGVSYKHRSFNTLDKNIYKDYSSISFHIGITW